MKFLLPVVILLVLVAGCNIINPPETIPTYIRIDSVNIKPNTITDITTNNITSVWVYADNQIVGVYELPASIPVIADKATEIVINAGVDYTGHSGQKVVYPFYSYDTITLTPQPGSTINFTPTVEYLGITQPRYKEDFETGNTFDPFNPDIADDSSLSRTNDPSMVFGGKGSSGYIYLTREHHYSQNINNTAFPLKVGEAYIEIDYKCSIEFKVGLQASTSGSPVYEPIVTIRPTDTWKKLYIGLQDFLNRFQKGPYRVVILSELPDGQEDGYVLIDNIQAISY